MKYYVAVLTAALFLFFGLITNCQAKNDDIFWFILAADTHIGDSDQCAENLIWLVNDAKEVINPKVIINAGDLTDQHAKAVLIRDVQDQQQWVEYYAIPQSSDSQTLIYRYILNRPLKIHFCRCLVSQ
ncbi:MAG: hypothetical protein V1688_02675 [bacterium]